MEWTVKPRDRREARRVWEQRDHIKVWKSSQKWSAQRSAVRSIAWLDGSRGCSLDGHIARITGRDVKARSIVEGVKLVIAVVALRKVKRATVARMQCVVASAAGAS